MSDAAPGVRRSTSSIPLVVGLYAAVFLLSLVQRPGQTTHDTRLELTSDPSGFLRGAFYLWQPGTTFGEIQNQAYGYLFPQGTFFVAVQHLRLPMWLGERIWSALILVAALEGARRVARCLGLGPLAALCAAIAYGLAPRLVTTDGVISAEALVTAVLPWVVLPLLLTLEGRLNPTRAMLLSAVALLFTGGVNAAENIAILPLPLLVVGWAVVVRRLRPRDLLVWCAAVIAATAWWLLPLLASTSYGLPFYDFVESARNTTNIAGWSESLRGTTHWVGYLVVGNQPWWPAGWALSTSVPLTLLEACIGAVGVIGLGRLDHPARTPLVWSAVVGFICIAIPHGTWAGGPLSAPLQEALDGALAAFRNVHKADPLIRLPLAVGFGFAVATLVEHVVDRRAPLRSVLAYGAAVACLAIVVLSPGLPLMRDEMRTPGWTASSNDDWQAVSRYLARMPDAQRTVTLVVPGAPFAANVWGWTIEEPFVETARTPWATRSQIPLSSGQNIRFLDSVQSLLGDASGTQALGPALARAGVGQIVLRDDLDSRLTETPSPSSFAEALQRAGGVTRTAGFGALSVWKVADVLPRVRVTAESDVRTVQGAAGDVVRAYSAGALDPRDEAIVAGEDNWDQPVDLVTDGNVRTERAFGRIYDAVGAPMGAHEKYRNARPYHDYPGAPGARQVTARYDHLASLTASSSAGYADSFGAVRPEYAPYAAVDFSEESQWVSSAAEKANNQWVELSLDEPTRLRSLRILATVTDRALVPVRKVRVTTDRESRVASVDPVTGEASVRLSGAPVEKVRVDVESTGGGRSIGPVGIRDIKIPGMVVARTLVVPAREQAADAEVLLGTPRERRACVPDASGPDCDTSRIRASSETLGMDRTVHLERPGVWQWHGTVVARTRAAAAALLNPLGTQQLVRASSTYGDDPAVSPRMAYDGQPKTGWRSAPGDAFPTLQFVWDRRQRVSAIQIESNEAASSAPRQVSMTVHGATNKLTLDATGTARFPPVEARRFAFTFQSPGDSAVAVSEIRFPGGPDVTRLLDRSGPTGATCGLGPEIFIDGVPHATSVRGTIADIVDGTPLEISMCREPVAVDAGWHRVQARSTEEFQVTSLISSGPTETPSEAASGRSVAVEHWTSSAREVKVGAGEKSVISIPENFNRGWRATLDGRELTSVRTEGWQQGWLLPPSGAGTVDIVFRGQRDYVWALGVGLVLAMALVVAAFVTRSRPVGRTAPVRRSAEPLRGRRASLSVNAGLFVLLALLAPWLAVGKAIGSAPLRLSRTWAAPLMLLLAAAGIDVLGMPLVWTVAADAMTAVGVGWALAPGLRGIRR